MYLFIAKDNGSGAKATESVDLVSLSLRPFLYFIIKTNEIHFPLHSHLLAISANSQMTDTCCSYQMNLCSSNHV